MLSVSQCYEALQHKFNLYGKMNRIRCTKLLLLIVFLSLFAYLMLKDESICVSVDSVHSLKTAREVNGLLLEGQYLFHSGFKNKVKFGRAICNDEFE